MRKAHDTGQLRKENLQLKAVLRRQQAHAAHHRRVARDAGHVSADRAGRPDRQADSGPRRKRHRQGAGRPRAPRGKPPRRQAAGGHQLRRAARDAARERIVRLRERRVHRRRRHEAGPVRGRRRRHAVHRRDRRAGRRAAGQAAARARRRHAASRRLGEGTPRPRAADRRHQSRLAGRGQSEAIPRGSLLPHQRARRSICRRCDSVPATCGCWSNTLPAAIGRSIPT